MKDKKVDRRYFISSTALAATGLVVSKDKLRAVSFLLNNKKESDLSFKIGVCDWMILKRQKLGAFERAKEIGVDGVEVDMGGLGNRKDFDNKLNDPKVRKAFLQKASSLNLKICSLAMSAFYSQSFPKRENAVELVRECIDTMKEMDVKVAFLPMGIKGDLVKHPEVRPDIVKRLKEVGRSAEKAGVIIGIETSLDAAGEVKLLDDIGSNAIQSYFNFENPVQAGRNIYKELKILGKNRICHIHCTDKDGVWLQNDPLIDMNKVKSTLNTMGWSGWLVMQRSRDAKDPHNIILNYGTNASYLKKVFQS